MKYVDGILVAEGDRLMAYAFSLKDHQQKQVSWKGKKYRIESGPWKAEWMELEDSNQESLLGIQLYLYDRNTSFTAWLKRFSNTELIKNDTSMNIFFREPVGTYECGGPFLPVTTFVSVEGEFLIYITELFSGNSSDTSKT